MNGMTKIDKLDDPLRMGLEVYIITEIEKKRAWFTMICERLGWDICRGIFWSGGSILVCGDCSKRVSECVCEDNDFDPFGLEGGEDV